MNLYPYQETGIEFLLAHNRCILADDMGLGKSRMVLEAINRNTSIRTALIVCPASLKANWHNEISKWLKRDIAYAIVNYERLGTALSRGASSIPHMAYDVAIIDEAHYCKTMTARRTQNTKEATKLAKRLWLATGTPMENRPVELLSLISWLFPDRFPDTERYYIEYTKRYCQRKYIRTNAAAYFASGGRRGCSLDVSGAANMGELAEKTKDFIIRRLKKDVLTELPPKTKQLVVLNTVANDSDLIRDLESIEDFDVLVKRLRATKVLFTEWAKRRHEQALDKVDDVVGYIHERYESGQVDGKVILFAHHRDVIDRYCEEFTALGYEPVRLTGSTPLAERAKAVATFQNDSACKIIIASIKAAGVGLTLTAGTWVAFAEIDPNPGIMNQAGDRAHRIGQLKNVLVSYFVFDRSIDAKMCKLLLKKEESIGEFERGITT